MILCICQKCDVSRANVSMGTIPSTSCCLIHSIRCLLSFRGKQFRMLPQWQRKERGQKGLYVFVQAASGLQHCHIQLKVLRIDDSGIPLISSCTVQGREKTRCTFGLWPLAMPRLVIHHYDAWARREDLHPSVTVMKFCALTLTLAWMSEARSWLF